MVTREAKAPAASDCHAFARRQLAGHRMFGVLPETAVTELAAVAIERTFSKGHHLFYACDPVVYIHVLVSGVAAMTQLGGSGNAHPLITFSTDEVLGIAPWMMDGRWTVDAVAVTCTRALLLPLDVFDVAYHNHREFAHAVACELARRFLESQEITFRLAQTPVVARVAKFLLDGAQQRSGARGGPPVLELAASYQELALMLGTTRETVTRAVARLSRSGLVALDGRHVRILKPEALQRVAEI